MALLGRFINRYRIFWTIVLLLFGAFVYWMLFVKPSSPIYTDVDTDLVRNESIQDKPDPRQKHKERLESINMDVSKVEFSLSSQDGSLIMRVWADEMHKEDRTYSISSGAVQFMLENENALLLSLSECTIDDERGLVEVGGEIIGQIRDTPQYFSAKALTWVQDRATVEITSVSFVGPNIEVVGEQMVVDLETGVVTFEGPVEAGI